MELANNPSEIMASAVEAAHKKEKTPVKSLLFLGILGGAFIALGGLISTFAAGSLLPLKEEYPLLLKLVSGITFPLGLILTVLLGAELFTSNTAYMSAAIIRKEISGTTLLKNWGIVYVSNFIGALLLSYFLVYAADLLGSQAVTYLKYVALSKVSNTWDVVFLRGIGANWLVCLAVWLSLSAKDISGKIAGIWWPVMAFVALGFEHSIANMFYIPSAIMYGADISWGTFLWNNLLPATLGNIVGGGLFVGALFAWLDKKAVH